MEDAQRAGLLARVRDRQEWKFFAALYRADRRKTAAWWSVLVLRGVLPAVFAIAMGLLVRAVSTGVELLGPLALTGIVFVALQTLAPVHQALNQNLGSRTAAWLYDKITDACVDPPGMGHLEDPALAEDLGMARDFDLGRTGPPLVISMDFIASGMVELLSGVASAGLLFGYRWWAPLVLGGGWLSTQWLLRESGIWKDRNTSAVREAQRHADYAYRLAVDAPAAKEVRLFGLDGWTVERFRTRRRQLFDLQWEATRLRERPVLWSLGVVVAANAIVFLGLARSLSDGSIDLGGAVVFAQAAIGVSALAFGGFSWAMDAAAAPVAATLRLGAATAVAGALPSGDAAPDGLPSVEIAFRDVCFAYPTGEGPDGGRLVLDHFDLTIPAGSSLAIVGVNGAGKTTLAKLLCRLCQPQSGQIQIDGHDLADLELGAWRQRITAVFQDFIRFEWPLRDNVAPRGADDETVLAALAQAGAADLADLDTVLARGYAGGTDLSGGQWQRVALARTLCAIAQGAGLVLLDEPTAQLDVRGEAEIFSRILQATRGRTTILISHRFSTVRHADRICVLEHGKAVELGTHDELMAVGGRYATMFSLQASRFSDDTDEEGVALESLG